MYDAAHEAERFNKFHAPAGSAAGGQFAAASGSSSKAAKGKDTRPTPTNQHPVGQGETGKRVSDLQERLNAGGFKPPLKVDGIFGPKTLAAVKAFQKAHGLKVDGLIGPLTTAALRGEHPTKHGPAHTAPHGPAKKPAAPKTAKRDAEPYGHEHYVARSRLLREQAGLVW
jgi:peptidoglycan hydrolase-like protein with peptidoglycan-binding domain